MASIVRPPEAFEIPQLLDIEAAAATVFPPGRLPDPPQTMSLRELQAAAAAGLLWVIGARGAPAGFAAASRTTAATLHLEEMDVHPRFGRQGLGTRLLQHVLAQARRLGFAEVTLTTFADLPWNAPFYEKAGFAALPVDQLEPRLAALLQAEQAAGMRQRVAMRRLLV